MADKTPGLLEGGARHLTAGATGMEPQEVPLCVDLDGTLLHADTLFEAALLLLKTRPMAFAQLPSWLLGGRASLKRRITELVDLDIAGLPVNTPFLEYLEEEHRRGRKLILVTGADAHIGAAVAQRYQFFDEVLSSDGTTNLRGERKAAVLEQRFGKGNFDYAGNEQVDVKVWVGARRAIVVNASSAVLQSAREVVEVERVFPHAHGTFHQVTRALRVHQWAKNLLLFVPFICGHHWAELGKLISVLLAFVAFSLCASSVYVLNDLLDLEADRHHPRKRFRPFASGRLPLQFGMVGAPLLLAASAAVALLLPVGFITTLGLYYLLTLSYTVRLKRVEILDVFVLAALYGMRIIAGGAAARVVVSDWLLVFGGFFFLSLAFVKRFTEIQMAQRARLDDVRGRGYRPADLALVKNMGIASGYLAILVLSFYITNPLVTQLYRNPAALWFACPVLLYWISRTWLLAHRELLHDDPLVFALRDRQSWLICLIFIVIGIAALPK